MRCTLRYAKMLNKIKNHLPLIVVSILFLAYYVYKNTSTYIGEYDAIHKSIHDKTILHKLASSCEVTLENRGSSSGNNNDKRDGSSTYYVIGEDKKIDLFMIKLKELHNSLIESESARIHGRGRSGSEEEIFGFDFSYSRGSRDGFVDVRRVRITKDFYRDDVIGEVYDLRIISYEHQ